MVYIVIGSYVLLNVMSNCVVQIKWANIYKPLITNSPFLLLACIKRYIYQTCRVFTLNTCRQYVLVIHLNDDSVGYRHYRQCSKDIDKIIF